MKLRAINISKQNYTTISLELKAQIKRCVGIASYCRLSMGGEALKGGKIGRMGDWIIVYVLLITHWDQVKGFRLVLVVSP